MFRFADRSRHQRLQLGRTGGARCLDGGGQRLGVRFTGELLQGHLNEGGIAQLAVAIDKRALERAAHQVEPACAAVRGHRPRLLEDVERLRHGHAAR